MLNKLNSHLLCRLGNLAVCLLAMLLVSTYAWAAGDAAHSEHGPAIFSLVWPLANFSLFSFLILRIYRRSVVPLLRDRQISVTQALQESAEKLGNAEQELERVKCSLADISELQAEVVERLERDGQQQSAEIVRNAEAAAERSENDAVRRISGELRKAEEEVRREVIARATELARARLKDGLSDDDDSRLRRETVLSVM